MAGLMEGKVGIVTGGGSGIGRASAIAFGTQGAKVLVADHNEENAEEVLSKVRDAGGEAAFFKVDVTNEEQVRAMVEFCVGTFGRLDFAHNNAGVTLADGKLLAESDTAAFDRVMKINVYGVLFSMKYEIPAMLEAGGGAIVNTGSVNGIRSTARGMAYGTSKFAVTGLTQAAALDYADQGIRVNSIGPSMTDTPMVAFIKDAFPEKWAEQEAAIPMKKLGKPEDMANAAVFLCSDLAGHITAQHLCVDGGQTAVL